jgi:hypothetical protein
MVCTVRCQILYSEISILFLEWNQGNKEKKKNYLSILKNLLKKKFQHSSPNLTLNFFPEIA